MSRCQGMKASVFVFLFVCVCYCAKGSRNDAF